MRLSYSRRFLLLFTIFGISLTLIGSIYVNFPELKEDERQHFKLPRDLDDAKKLGRVLSNYKDDYFFPVLGAVSITYLFLQSFAIPGSIFLSIMSGYLFPFPLALLLVCTCSACGAAICYLLSYLVGKNLVLRYFPERVAKWSTQVSHHREHLFNYMLFLRITPFLPNWFINIASPVIDVPMTPFFWGTFFGVAPPSFFFIQTGQTLSELTVSDSSFSLRSVALLAVFALASLAPVIFKQRLRRKLD